MGRRSPSPGGLRFSLRTFVESLRKADSVLPSP
jgi:hypothetical protein